MSWTYIGVLLVRPVMFFLSPPPELFCDFPVFVIIMDVINQHKQIKYVPGKSLKKHLSSLFS